MPQRKITFIGILIIIIAAIAWFKFKPETNLQVKSEKLLEGTWVEKNNPNGDRFTFSASPQKFVEETTRQVGANTDKELPFPTLCRFRQTAERYRIDTCSLPDCKEAKAMLTYFVKKVELIESNQNSKSCKIFITRQMARIAKAGDLSYSYAFYEAPSSEDLMVRNSSQFALFEKQK